MGKGLGEGVRIIYRVRGVCGVIRYDLKPLEQVVPYLPYLVLHQTALSISTGGDVNFLGTRNLAMS